MFRRLCAAGVFLFTCCACLAQTGELLTLSADQWAPPLLTIPDSLPTASNAPLMISSFRIGSLDIRLGKTTRSEAQHHLGGEIGAKGDASNYEVWLCYRGKDDHGPWGLWLVGGEIDGPAIGSFQWQRLLPGEELDPRCKSLSGGDQPKLPHGISLDMPESQVRVLLGKSTLENGQILIYLHSQKVNIHQLPYTTENLVTFDIQNGVVQAIAANLTTSD